jgi:hypothetical protein
MVQLLPGMGASSDERNDIVVRGGSPTEVRFLLDGIEIANPNHFGTMGATGGPIGMINADFIQEAKFYAGGFPARYGDRLSGVVDISQREGSRDRLTGTFSFGITGPGLSAEGPLGGGKGSWLIGGSYVHPIILEKLLGIAPEYGTLTFKTTYDLDHSNNIQVLGIGGLDAIKMEAADNDTFPHDEEVNFRTKQYAVGVIWRRLIGGRGFARMTLSRTWNQYFVDVDTLTEERKAKRWLQTGFLPGGGVVVEF